MTLFDTPGPRLFFIPPGADPAASLARGLTARLAGAPPEAVARVTLALNTGRALRAVRAAFLAQAESGAAWLPRLSLIAAMGDEAGLPPAIDPAARLLALTRLVAALLAGAPDLGPPAAAPALAQALAAFLDEAGREGVDLAGLQNLAPQEHAAHWERALVFLRIVAEAWPAELAARGLLDPQARRRRALDALLARWRETPPAAPILAAGSTGSIATTARLLEAAAQAPQGAAILPGFDPAFAEAEPPPGHPWGAITALIRRLGLDPRAIPSWDPGAPAATPRRRLLAEALRPAPATDGWRAAAPRLAAEAAEATAGLDLCAAPDPRREAEAIALAIREEVERGGRAALVTPDRTLARRVGAELERWGVFADDSAGRPLPLSPPGALLRLVARLGFEGYDPVDLLGLLKHPLVAAGSERGSHLLAVRAFEIHVLRRRRPPRSLAEARDAEPARAGERDRARIAALGPMLDRLAALAAMDSATLADRAAAHRDAAEALCGPALWTRSAGLAARAAFDGFTRGAAEYGPCPARDYLPLFDACFAGDAPEEAQEADPRALIWGGLEARGEAVDLTVLGGLNEASWPAEPPPDPWLSRPMRAALGLPSPERRIGLAAHDFLLAAARPRALLTRALRAEGKPTDASRFWRRLETLLGGVAPDALNAMKARGAVHLARAALLDAAPGPAQPEPRPRPAPPVAARPATLYATDVERLIRDPYAAYARHILRLRPLDPLARAEDDPAERGAILHVALERHGQAMMQGAAPGDAFAIALAEAEAEAGAPRLARLWRARLTRLAPVFLAQEADRLAAGRILALEAPGARAMAAPALTLRARADRIDARPDGLAIYDYKSGDPPSENKAKAFQVQMPLEAAIALGGGFGAERRVAELGYISLKTGAASLLSEPETMAQDAWEKLARLIAHYDQQGAVWPSRLRPQWVGMALDYDHLARFGEWREAEE